MRIGHASGGDPSGAPGDQSGREVRIQNWYGGNWDVLLRAKDPATAERMAAFCESVCANDKVGYSQTTRNTLRDAARAAGWDGAKITTACNCDCASFMSVCAEAAGVNMDSAYTYGNAPWTGNMKMQFTGTGAFDALPVPDAAYLRRGDVLVNETQHTIMVLDSGEKSGVEAVPYKAGDTVTYKAGEGIYFRPDTLDVCTEADTHSATVIAVKPGAARPVLVLLDGTDVCGWVSLSSLGAERKIHIVQAGDTVWGISVKYGVSMQSIAAANGMGSIYDLIHPGDKLVIPEN